ncbi:uncharacterized protein LOC115751426 [Rhodamnia argentea]|uniref:Uncharacterized protein LOC115751426 n=1 Tax=Rhodamnia argentea TaxID=178133 RepID=A0A8B8QDK2_9MYRT|nr:uncharacterized protein LOC115751426 [Rhodamnia argentea]
MRRREAIKLGAPSTDFLVCFPPRAHLQLMPKPVSSPARPSEPSKLHPHSHHQHQLLRHRHCRSKSFSKGAQASPVLWVKTKQIGPVTSEPTSPKVTCAGQIKVRTKTGACKSWQSVMAEIERIHNDDKRKKRPTWGEALGFNKDIMQFLTCLRNIKFKFRCFGSFPDAQITSDEEVDEDDECRDHDDDRAATDRNDSSETSRTAFSKWFTLLQEGNTKIKDLSKHDRKEKGRSWDDGCFDAPVAPPPNALLLMRCRSAPAKAWLVEREEQEHEQDADREIETKKNLKLLIDEAKREEEEERKQKECFMMRYDADYYNISTDIAKETWIFCLSKGQMTANTNLEKYCRFRPRFNIDCNCTASWYPISISVNLGLYSLTYIKIALLRLFDSPTSSAYSVTF